MNYIKVKNRKHKVLVRALMQIKRETTSNKIYNIAEQALDQYRKEVNN